MNTEISKQENTNTSDDFVTEVIDSKPHAMRNMAIFSIACVIYFGFCGSPPMGLMPAIVISSFPCVFVWAFILSNPISVRLDSKGVTLLFRVFPPEFFSWSQFITIEELPYVALGGFRQTNIRTSIVKYEGGGSFNIAPSTPGATRVIEILKAYDRTRQIPSFKNAPQEITANADQEAH